jgi:hypothetical protein
MLGGTFFYASPDPQAYEGVDLWLGGPTIDVRNGSVRGLKCAPTLGMVRRPRKVLPLLPRASQSTANRLP